MRSSRTFLLVAFLIGIPVQVVFASDRIRHYTEREGLSSRIIHHCLKDSRGFIWVATSNGLNRFDGYKFWQPDHQTLPLSTSRITWLLEDHNLLWIGSDNGINLMDLESYQLKGILRHNASPSSLHDNYITGIFHGFDRSIWVTTGQGMLHHHLGSGNFRWIKNPLEASGSFGVRVFFTEDDHFLWIKSENKGIYKLSKQGELLTYFPLEGNSHIGAIRYLPGIGTLSFDRSGINLFNPNTNRFSPYLPIAGKDIYDLVSDGLGKLWLVHTDSKRIGVITGDKLTDKTEVLFPPPYVVHIRTIIPGSRKSLWMCTNNGLYYLSNEKELFTTLLKPDHTTATHYIPSFRGMFEEPDGTLYMGGYGGIFRRDSEGAVNTLVDNTTPFSPYVLLDEAGDFFWAVTEGFGLIRIHKRSGKVKQLFKSLINPEHHRFQYLDAAFKDHDGTFWLGGYEGMFRYDPRHDKIFEVNLWFNNQQLGKMTIRQFRETRNGNLWISTQNGVYVLDRKRKPLYHFNNEAREPFRIPENTVSCILESSAGDIWIATVGGGLCRWNPRTRVLNTFNNSNGLANDLVVSLLEDRRGFIWAATNFGLSKLNPVTGIISNFYAEDGLADNEFNAGSALRLRNGNLLFGGVNGITVCDPDADLRLEEKSQQIQFSRLEVIDEEGHMKEVFSPDQIAKGITLSYANRYVGLDFFVSDFLRVEQNAFMYQLAGFDNRWIPLGEQNNLRFAMLPPGNFKLRIKGTGFRGNPTLNEITLPIVIENAFFRTWWFYTLCLVIAVLLVYLTLFQKIRKLRYLNALRTKLSSDLHDDVGSVLTRIAMQAELIQSEVPPAAKSVLTSMILSCRNGLNNMRDVIWSMDTRNLNAGNLFDKITELCHQLFNESGKSIEVSIDKELFELPIRQQTREEVYFIVKEAMHNMLKYGDGLHYSFAANLTVNGVSITLQNTTTLGQPKTTSGYGLRNMNMRANRIKALFAYKILPPATFTITLAIPFFKLSLFKKTL